MPSPLSRGDGIVLRAVATAAPIIQRPSVDPIGPPPRTKGSGPMAQANQMDRCAQMGWATAERVCARRPAYCTHADGDAMRRDEGKRSTEQPLPFVPSPPTSRTTWTTVDRWCRWGRRIQVTCIIDVHVCDRCGESSRCGDPDGCVDGRCAALQPPARRRRRPP